MKTKPFGFKPEAQPITRNLLVLSVVLYFLTTGLMPTALAQGTVIFNNRATGAVISRVYDAQVCFAGNGTNDFPVGLADWSPYTKLSGSAWFAQLLAAPGADQPEYVLAQAFPTTTFRTGAAAGNIAGVIATLPNVLPDALVATVQMVVWDNSSGLYPTWGEAQNAYSQGLIRAARSPKFNLYNIGGKSNLAPFLTNLVSFSMHYPEGSGDPHIFVQPQSQTVRAGSNVSFHVETSLCGPAGPGDAYYQYQWSFNGANLASATTSSLNLTNV